MKKVHWHSNHSLSRSEGYRTSTEEICDGLEDLGLDIINHHESVDKNTIDVLSSLNIEYAVEVQAKPDEIVVSNSLPGSYQMSDGYNIGFTYWETNQLPKDWVEKMNQMDEIWTASQWARKIYTNSGVSVPIHAFRLGVDSRLYFPQRRPHKEQVKFLNIGSPSTRKNSQMAVDAFLKVLGGDERFQLIYKTIGPPDARIGAGTGGTRSLYGHPNITVIDEDLTPAGLAALYDRIDCLIYPTSGEGWGWLPQQAIAKGIPTICTSGTACEEYAFLSLPLDYKWGTKGMFGLYEGNGEWMEPNFDDLCDKIYEVSRNYGHYAEMTFNNVSPVYESMTWESVIKDYSDRLCQI